MCIKSVSKGAMKVDQTCIKDASKVNYSYIKNASKAYQRCFKIERERKRERERERERELFSFLYSLYFVSGSAAIARNRYGVFLGWGKGLCCC